MSKKSSSVNKELVKHVSKLANIPISDQEANNLSEAFNQTLKVIDQLQQVDTQNTEPTHQVTGLENNWREDEIDEQPMFSQEQALANAKKTYQGYFVVPRIIHKSEE